MEQLEQLLRASGNRMTAPRRQVFTVLEQANQPLSLQQILTQVGDIDRTSVYRVLELFDQLAIIEIIPVGWKKRYELASPFQPHHHHLECMHCHELIALNAPEIEQLITEQARVYGYKLTSHHIELRGLCARCQAVNLLQ